MFSCIFCMNQVYPEPGSSQYIEPDSIHPRLCNPPNLLSNRRGYQQQQQSYAYNSGSGQGSFQQSGYQQGGYQQGGYQQGGYQQPYGAQPVGAQPYHAGGGSNQSQQQWRH